MDPLPAGALGGLAGTVLMTALMMPLTRGQPSATQIFASRFLNTKPPEQNQLVGTLLHVFYGVVMGVVLVVGLDAIDEIASFSLGALVTYGAAFGLLLFFGMFAWMRILGMDKGMAAMPTGAKLGMMGGMLAVHLLYGATLGLVVALLVA